jgi:UDP-perosamine 4-acetyltransferase
MANREQAALPPVIVLGSGGHAAVLIDALQAAGRVILGCADPNVRAGAGGPLGTEILGGDEAPARYRSDGVELVNGVGATDAADTPGGQLRSRLHRTWRRRSFVFATIVHPAATVAAGCDIAAGVQLMAGAVVQTGTRIGAGSIVNTGARVDHDCDIGELVHIAPGAVLCGGVTVADGAFVGAGATVIPGVRIGAGARIGAGMTVLDDLPAATRLSPAGAPGRGVATPAETAAAGAIRAAATVP